MHIHTTRRHFLQQSTWAVLGAALTPYLPIAKPTKTVLLRSLWQTVNIGDVAHAPGALALLYRYLPKGTRIILWPTNLENGAEQMVRAAFPQLTIVTGTLNAEGQPTTEALANAIAQADVFVHGSGSGLPAEAHVHGWRKLTNGKPYGLFGVSIWGDYAGQRAVLENAAFVFVRDTQSLQHIRSLGLRVAQLAFGPDAAFGTQVRDEAKALAFMQTNGLRAAQFACFIPRLRYTPYWKILGKTPTEEDTLRYEISQRYQELDHAKMRHAIVEWVRQTGHPAVFCAEMTYQNDMMEELLFDQLPADVKPKVVWHRAYWMPDEAISLYSRARAVVSFEMHSPILACAAGTPSMYLRQPTDTSKGQMWRDVGFANWILEIDDTTGAQVAERLLDIHQNQAEARRRVQRSQRFVHKRQRAMVEAVAACLKDRK